MTGLLAREPAALERRIVREALLEMKHLADEFGTAAAAAAGTALDPQGLSEMQDSMEGLAISPIRADLFSQLGLDPNELYRADRLQLGRPTGGAPGPAHG